jgi:hypothetical protein
MKFTDRLMNAMTHTDELEAEKKKGIILKAILVVMLVMFIIIFAVKVWMWKGLP